MSLSPRYEFPADILIAANQKVINSPKLLQRALKRREARLRQLTLKIVAKYPGRPKPGITRKMTPRQRRAFYASEGFGGGIPHQRAGGLLKAYDAKFQFTEDGGAFVVENTYTAARYIIGEAMQPFHLDTGYRYLPDVVDKEIVPLVLQDYETTFLSIANPFI